MGGHAAGEVASRVAVEASSDFIRRSWTRPISPGRAGSIRRSRSRQPAAHGGLSRQPPGVPRRPKARRLHRHGHHDRLRAHRGTATSPSLMSATAALYLLSDGVLAAADARRFLGGDHPRRSDGRRSRGDRAHPMRHVLTNVLGAREQTEIHLRERALSDGEILLLCSDGLHNVRRCRRRSRRCWRRTATCTASPSVVTAALDRGSRDNVTALVVRYAERDAWHAREPAPRADAGAHRPLPHHRAHRPRRDGRGLLGARRSDRPAGRAESDDGRSRGASPRSGRASFARRRPRRICSIRTSSPSSTPARTRDHSFIAMELLAGAPLTEFLDASGRRRRSSASSI